MNLAADPGIFGYVVVSLTTEDEPRPRSLYRDPATGLFFYSTASLAEQTASDARFFGRGRSYYAAARVHLIEPLA